MKSIFESKSNHFFVESFSDFLALKKWKKDKISVSDENKKTAVACYNFGLIV